MGWGLLPDFASNIKQIFVNLCLFPLKSSESSFLTISVEMEVNQFAQIFLTLEAKFGDDHLSKC